MTSSSTPKFSNIALTKEEADAIYTPDWDFEEDPKTILIGHLISSKPIDDWAVLTAFEGIWRNNNLSSISVIKESYFRIKFATASDRKDVFERGPWLYKLEWLALAEYDPVKNVDEYSFSMMRIWFRILTIPAPIVENIDRAHMVGQSLGAIVGTALRTDTRKENGNMTAFLRVEIMLDITRPIRRFLLIGKGNNQKSCQLQYERLPIICHGFGIVCHTFENCPNKFAYDPNNLQYGDWLRYLPPRRRDQGPRGRIRVVDHITPAQNLPSMDPSEKGKAVAAQSDSGYSPILYQHFKFRHEIPAFTVPQPDEAMQVLVEKASNLNVNLQVAHPIDPSSLNGLKLALEGEHQYLNAGLAVVLCTAWLQRTGHPISNFNQIGPLPEPFIKGLTTASLQGRAQIVHDQFTDTESVGDLVFYLDGAHSPESMEACARWFSLCSRYDKQTDERSKDTAQVEHQCLEFIHKREYFILMDIIVVDDILITYIFGLIISAIQAFLFYPVKRSNQTRRVWRWLVFCLWVNRIKDNLNLEGYWVFRKLQSSEV